MDVPGAGGGGLSPYVSMHAQDTSGGKSSSPVDMIDPKYTQGKFTQIPKGVNMKEDDLDWAMMMAEDFQCTLCSQTLLKLMREKQTGNTVTSDDLMDAFDGEVDETRVARAKDKL